MAIRRTMLVYRPHKRDPNVTEFATDPKLEEVEATVGGPLEQVPGFFSIDHHGVVRPCVALCAQDGKRLGLHLNVAATILWDHALRRDMGVGLIRANGARADHLVGSVAVFFTE